MTVTCTVCEHEFDHADAASVLDVEDDRYTFCSAHCREQLDQEPSLYVDLESDGTAGLGAAAMPAGSGM